MPSTGHVNTQSGSHSQSWFSSKPARSAVQGLLRELLGALPERGDPRRARVLGAAGAALAVRSLAEDAALAFLAAGQPERALGQYRAAGQWRMALALAGAR